jgi:myo-inositol-1(or 4)-monophosphatase
VSGLHYAALTACADAVGETVASGQRRGYSGGRETQYHLDLDADARAVSLLTAAGYRVMSEESGMSGEGEFVVVIDPIDGSTNCDRGVPFYAISLCVMRGSEPVAGFVRNLATGTTFYAEAGAGATRDGEPISVARREAIEESIIAFSGLPSRRLPWAQFRALGAASLEICLVADGTLDAYTVASYSKLHPWDYLAGLLVLKEAGGCVAEYDDLPLLITDAVPRRPIFAGSDAVLNTLLHEGIL